MKTFGIKPEIKAGEDSLSYLKTLPYKKYFIVTDEMMVQLKLTDKIIDNLNSDCKIKIFSKVLPNPTVDIVQKGIVDLITFEPECVIALGGGSPIDACKAILYFGDKIFNLLGKKNERLFIAVPTTSGTGSEVTSYSVITDHSSKIALADDKMLPNIAVLNPDFMKTLPKKVVADTGMDVLTHALEAYVSRNSNPFTDAMALEAMRIVFNNLLDHYEDRSTLEPREKIQYASCMAGIAFNNSSLGINHSIAHSIGAKFHIPHGRANAILLPYIIEVNSNADKKYAAVAEALGLPASTTIEGKHAVKIWIKIMKEKMEIENSLKEYGIDFEEFKKLIPEILSDIKKDICTEYNPNQLSDEEYVKLLVKVYYGE